MILFTRIVSLSLVALGLLIGCSADGPSPALMDAGQRPADSGSADMAAADAAAPTDAGTDAGTDGGIDERSDTSMDATSDGGRMSGLGERWLDSVAARGAAFCECETSVRDYETIAECAAAEASAGARECAGSALLALTELHEGFECLADAFETQAACMAAADCDNAALNACESVSGPVIAACPPTEAGPLGMFFASVGECVRGTPGTCPERSASGLGQIASGSTLAMGNDYAPSCAAGADVAPDVSVSWQAPATGMYRFDTFGSSFDTQLAIFAACMGEELACNDDSGDRRTSSVERMVTEGDTLTLVVDGFDELSVGDFVLNVQAL